MADFPPSDQTPPHLPTSLPVPPASGSSTPPVPPIQPQSQPQAPRQNPFAAPAAPFTPPKAVVSPSELEEEAESSLAAYSPLRAMHHHKAVPPVPPSSPAPVAIPLEKEEAHPAVQPPSPTRMAPLPMPVPQQPVPPKPVVSPIAPPAGIPISVPTPPRPVSLPIPTPTPPKPASLPVPTPSPMPIPLPSAPVLDREELLKQAAEAPEQTFILPSLATGIVDEVLPPVQSRPQPVEAPPHIPTPQVPVSRPVDPPPRHIPAVPIPPLPITTPVQPLSQPTPPLPHTEAPVDFAPIPKTGKHSHVLFGIIGGCIAVIALLAGLYILAANGTRVPVLYKALSGVDPSGVTASSQAVGKNDAQSTYQYQATIAIAQQGSSSSSSGLSGASSGTSPVYQVNSSIATGQVTNSNQTDTAYFEVAANGNAAVPVAVRTTAGATTAAYFPAGTSTSTIAVKNADLSNTLLEPVLSPLTIDTLFKAVKTETAYQKQALSNDPIASYNVTYDCTGLSSIFPKGATVSGCTGTIAFFWKTPTAGLAGLPAASSVAAIFKYKGETYTYQAQYRYSNWGQTISGPNSGDLVLINNNDLSALTATSMSDFVSSLGISFTNLAHDSSLDTGISQLPITPTGLTTTQVQVPLTTQPPPPAQPATAAAIARDTQRKHDLQDLQSALEAYKKDHGSYPTSSDGGDQVDASQTLFAALVPTYLTAMPQDPLKDTYYYLYISPSSGSGTYHLRSVLENADDSAGVKGNTYTYFDVYNP